MSSKEQTTSFWQQILDKALSNHRCMACDRDILEKDLKRIEEHVRSTAEQDRVGTDGQMQRRIANSRRGNAQELKEDEQNWLAELDNRRNLEVLAKTIEDLSERVIPPLEKQVEEEGAQIEKAEEEAEEVRSCGQIAVLFAELRRRRPSCNASSWPLEIFRRSRTLRLSSHDPWRRSKTSNRTSSNWRETSKVPDRSRPWRKSRPSLMR